MTHNDIRYDSIDHWPEMQDNKNRCRLCDMTCRATCKENAICDFPCWNIKNVPTISIMYDVYYDNGF